MVTRDVLKVFQIALAYGSCNFENFQNITRAHKSRNALAFMRFPILIVGQVVGTPGYYTLNAFVYDICQIPYVLQKGRFST